MTHEENFLSKEDINEINKNIKEKMIFDASSQYSDNISKIFRTIFGFEINEIKEFTPYKKELLVKYLDSNKEWLLINKLEEIKLRNEINLIEKASKITSDKRERENNKYSY